MSLSQIFILKTFLDSLFGTAIFILAILAILLIYSLMLSDIDSKTYEFGMLRALGFQNKNLIILLFC